MAGISTFLAHKLLDHVLRGTTYTPPTTVYMALYTSNPGDDDSGSEVSGNGYQRQPVTFSAPSGRRIVNSNQVEFPEATGPWGTITHFGLRDAQTGGNLLFYGELTASVTISAGQQLIFKQGDIIVEAT
ncbi:MAG: hypothetical protein QXM53_00775 [Thermofilaceae archaeon]